MALDDAETARFVALAAAAIDLPIPAESLPAVLQNFRVLASHAALVIDCPLPPEVQSAAVFRP
jgi:hypothetical protein